MEKRQANVGLSLLALHRCITRGIDVSTSNSRLFAAQGFPDTRTREGFINYVRSLGIVLLAHHLVEDEVGFPRLKTQIPEAPYSNLTAQHLQIQSMISEIEQIADQLEGDSIDSHTLERLAEILTELSILWRPHILTEETHFTPERIDALFPIDEQESLLAEIGQHSQQHSEPGYLTVPFTLFNLTSEDREVLTAEMPPIITQQLIPVVWKEKWQSMMPFLLPAQ